MCCIVTKTNLVVGKDQCLKLKYNFKKNNRYLNYFVTKIVKLSNLWYGLDFLEFNS